LSSSALTDWSVYWKSSVCLQCRKNWPSKYYLEERQASFCGTVHVTAHISVTSSVVFKHTARFGNCNWGYSVNYKAAFRTTGFGSQTKP